MLRLQEQCIENKRHDFQIFQQARVEAIKLQIADNWAELLNQLNASSVEFRLLVWHFWELDVFGEADVIIAPAETSTPHPPTVA